MILCNVGASAPGGDHSGLQQLRQHPQARLRLLRQRAQRGRAAQLRQVTPMAAVEERHREGGPTVA